MENAISEAADTRSIFGRLAGCSHADPNAKKGSGAGKWVTVNVPAALWQEVTELAECSADEAAVVGLSDEELKACEADPWLAELLNLSAQLWNSAQLYSGWLGADKHTTGRAWPLRAMWSLIRHALSRSRAAGEAPPPVAKQEECSAPSLFSAQINSDGSYRIHGLGVSFNVAETRDDAEEVAMRLSLIFAKSTPAAMWRPLKHVDPHAGKYDRERAELTLGRYTDDELANGIFLNYDKPLNIAAVLNGVKDYHPPIAWMTAGKERIRWLSRKLESELAARKGKVLLPVDLASRAASALFEVARTEAGYSQAPDLKQASDFEEFDDATTIAALCRGASLEQV